MPNILEIIRNFFLGKPSRKKIGRKRRKKVKPVKKRHLRVRVRRVRHIKKLRRYRKKPVKKLEKIYKIKKREIKRRRIKIEKIRKMLKVPRRKIKLVKVRKIIRKVRLPKFPRPKIFRPRKRIKIGIKKVPTKKIPKEIIKEVIAADIMTKNVYAVKPNDTLSYVVRLFADKKISGAPVVKGNNLVGMISESDIVKFVGTKELLARGSVGLKTLSEIKAEEAMHTNPVFVYEYTKLSEAADLMNKFDITRLPVLNERRELVGILTRSDMMRGISKELLFKLLERREIERILKVETDIDEILQIVERKGSIGIGEIKKRLMLPEDKIEEWGKILEKHNLIEMFYPPIGKPEFRKKIK